MSDYEITLLYRPGGTTCRCKVRNVNSPTQAKTRAKKEISDNLKIPAEDLEVIKCKMINNS